MVVMCSFYGRGVVLVVVVVAVLVPGVVVGVSEESHNEILYYL